MGELSIPVNPHKSPSLKIPGFQSHFCLYNTARGFAASIRRGPPKNLP